MQDQQGRMHPEDTRNLIIFIVLAALVWIGFDMLVMRPKMEAYREARQYEAAQKARMEEQAKNATPFKAADPALSNRAEETHETAPRITIDTPELSGSLSLKGGRIDDISLKNYFVTLEKKEQVTVMAPAGSAYPRYVEGGWLPSGALRVPDAATIWRSDDKTLGPETPVTLSWDNGQGLIFEKIYRIDHNFLITLEQRVINNTGQPVTVTPYILMSQHGIPPLDEERATSFHGPVGYIGEEFLEIPYGTLQKEPEEIRASATGWIGFTEHYWLTLLIPDQSANKIFRFSHSLHPQRAGLSLYQTDVRSDALTVPAGASGSYTTHVYAGAKIHRLISQYETDLKVSHLDLAMDFGMLYFLTKPFYWILTTFHGWVGNFGIAIIMLTILVRICVFPLANISYRSFAGLKKVAPAMQALQKQYANDKQKMQEELVKLYQREKVNPMAGCLPLLVQIPIFFALYKVLTISIEMRHAPFFGWIEDLSVKDPTSIFNLYGLLPYTVPEFLTFGIWPTLMLIFLLIQKQMNPPPSDPIQRTMMNVFPFAISLLLSKFASGLVIYWTFSNLLSIIQQYTIMRMMGVEVRFWGHKVEEIIPFTSEETTHQGEDSKETREGTAPYAPAPAPSAPPRPKKKKKK